MELKWVPKLRQININPTPVSKTMHFIFFYILILININNFTGTKRIISLRERGFTDHRVQDRNQVVNFDYFHWLLHSHKKAIAALLNQMLTFLTFGSWVKLLHMNHYRMMMMMMWEARGSLGDPLCRCLSNCSLSPLFPLPVVVHPMSVTKPQI